jgi:ADP-heptose:LPS heptosyltransferase
MAKRVVESLAAAIGNPDIAAHAAVFAAFEEIEQSLRSPRAKPQSSWPGLTRPSGDPRVKSGDDGGKRRPRRILVIRLSAFGDFIQSLGPMAAIRDFHRGDRVSLLTTRPFAGFAEELGLFDEVLVDDRPKPLALLGWLALRRRLRQGGFDRVYDLQTATRSNVYAWLLRPGMPEWSGIAWRASHPHANLDRDRQHTLDKQAEQLLMAGIYPTKLPALPPFDRTLPEQLAGREFVLLVPGSSPRHPAKRWPAARFALLAQALDEKGYLPVVVGSGHERLLAAAIAEACPAALDLVGRTDIALLAALAQRAALTVGNDTGVCHLATAAGCPVVVLFSRESDPARVAPRGALVRILAAPDLADLAPDTVIAEALTLAYTAGEGLAAGLSVRPLSPFTGRGTG